MDDPVRLGLALALLAGATLSDLRTRRVPNDYWWPWLAVAVVLVAADLLADPLAALPGLAWAIGTMAFLYGLWYLGLFGGADAKGLMILALLWPSAPDILDGRVTVPLDGLVNASVFIAVLPILFLAWNVARGHFGLPMLFGVRMARDRAQARHVWPMERVVDGTVQVRLWQRIGEPLEDAYRHLEEAGVERVWATPKVPFMLALVPGVLLADRVGNLLLWFMARVLT